MKARLLNCAFALAAPLWGRAYTAITDQHLDLQVAFAGGGYDGRIRADLAGMVARDQGLLYDGPLGTTAVARPASATWDFLGVAAGESIHYWPQSLVSNRIYLGFGSDHGAIAPGTFASYFKSDPRVSNTAPWTKIALLDVRYEAAPGESGLADFSLWQTGWFGPPDVWMSTAAGGITATDATWLITGGHSHYNWGFTKRGYYQIDFKFSGYLNDGSNTFVESTTQTFHFGIEYQPPNLPIDIAARGPDSIIADQPTADFRIKKTGSSGSIALGAAVTSIHSLRQNTVNAAAVDTALKILRTASIAVGNGGAALTIGTAAGDGNHTTASSVTKTGPGVLNLYGPQNYATLNATEGTTNLHAALGAGGSTLNADATVNIGESQTLAALHIGAEAAVTRGRAEPPSFAAVTVPEPGSICLLAASGLVLFACRRR